MMDQVANIIPQLSPKVGRGLFLETLEEGRCTVSATYVYFNYFTTVCETSGQRVKTIPWFTMSQPLLFMDTHCFYPSTWPLKNDFQLLFTLDNSQTSLWRVFVGPTRNRRNSACENYSVSVSVKRSQLLFFNALSIKHEILSHWENVCFLKFEYPPFLFQWLCLNLTSYLNIVAINLCLLWWSESTHLSWMAAWGRGGIGWSTEPSIHCLSPLRRCMFKESLIALHRTICCPGY